METYMTIQGGRTMPEKLVRLKPYKTSLPYDTVQKIRTILFEHDVFLMEIGRKSKISNTYSNRIVVTDEGLESLDIGTNGKGMTARYALASAYGEFMERVQNMTITPQFVPEGYFYKPENCERDFPDYNDFLDSCNAESSFLFSPDEKWMDVDDVLKETEDILKNMRVYQKIPAGDLRQALTEFSYDGKLACVPFYSVFEDRTVYLPYVLIKVNTGSNGMCAGNSPKEALIQGLAEIYERYAQQKIMMENLAAPDIDIELFRGTEVYRNLVAMAKRHLGIQILDFSCDMGLPVVALKIIEEDGGISIHPGADPSPITALERCLTESYQGATFQSRFKTEYMNPPEDPNDTERIKAFYENLKNSFINGSGAYPSNIQNDEKMPGFKGFAHPTTVSDEDDFQYMLDIAKRCGKNVYVRDNSYLGIPAYYVFIPGMSDIGFFPGPEVKNYLNFGRELYTLRSLPVAPIDDVKHLKEFIEADMKHKYAIISAKDCFPLGIRDYMPEEVLEDANKLLEALALQIDYLEGKGEPVFTEENWPVCYHCDRCAYREECKHKAFIKVFNSIRKTYKENVRPQTSEMLK